MRVFYIIGSVVVIAVALGTLLFFFGPSSLQSDVNAALQANNSVDVPIVVLAQGTDAASIDGRTNYRIQTNDEMLALWPMIYGNEGAPPMPTIDFSKYEVLAVFDGSHSTSGYGISVISVTDANAERDVVIDHIVPGSACPITRVQTDPFEIIQVPATTFALTHQDVTSTSTCQ